MVTSHELVHRREPSRQGPAYVEKENDTDAVGVIPHLVLVHVIKNDALAFLPIDHLVGDLHTDTRPRLRYDQSKMTPEHALVASTMAFDVHARRKQRKERKRQTGNGIQKLTHLRAAPVARVDPMTKGSRKNMISSRAPG
jgi:hypothetical protein